MKLKLRMTVDVEYDVDADLPEAEVPALSRRLTSLVTEAFGNGIVTDDLDACVEDYSIEIERMFA